MHIWISALGIAEPGPPITREQGVSWMEPRLHPQAKRERLHKFSQRSEIDTRYSVLDLTSDEASRFYPVGGIGGADLGERSKAFDRYAPPLAEAAVRNACLNGIGRITHVITTTCTGAVAPGLEIRLAHRLGLDASVRRLGINFMGCYAAIPALRAAWHTCLADPTARVLVVCCELSTLHLRPGPEDDSLLAAQLFGDGAAAVVVESAAQPIGTGLRFMRDASVLAANNDDQMTWMAHADVFRLHLSPLVTRELAQVLPQIASQLLEVGVQNESVRWAIHPGGPRILDAAERALALPTGALDPSRRELRRAGNRSSPTVLAITQEHLRESWTGPLALVAFGPGLTADAIMFERS